jgi:hypothetical protein
VACEQNVLSLDREKHGGVCGRHAGKERGVR